MNYSCRSLSLFKSLERTYELFEALASMKAQLNRIYILALKE